MVSLLNILYQWIQSPPFLLCSISLSFGVKTYFLTSLIPRGLRSFRIHMPWILLVGILIGSMFCDISWLLKLLGKMTWPHISYATVLFFIRVAWGFLALQYQSLALFIQSLTQKEFKLHSIQKILIIISILFALYFFYIAIFNPLGISEYERYLDRRLTNPSPPLEIKMMRAVSFYLLILLILPGLVLSLWKIRGTNLPKILKKQLKIFIVCLICPYLFVEILQAISIFFVDMETFLYPVVSVSTLLLTYAIYYCLKEVMHLRFLNFNAHIYSHSKINFIGQFKHVLAQLSQATSIHELGHITETFFKETFNMPLNATKLYICEQLATSADFPEISKNPEEILHSTVEQFISPHNAKLATVIAQSKILIYDDITFEHFYEETPESNQIIAFLDAIDADIFLPIYKQQKIIAYIIIKRNARLQECYNKEEKTEILALANYLSNIINLIQNRNIDSLIQQEKQLKEKVYYTHQEINQFKESIRSFLRNTNQKTIGVIFYKSRTFTFGNQAAKELIKIDLNQQEGHPISKAIKDIAFKVTDYKSHQTTMCTNSDGQRIVISGVPHLEQNCVLITVSYPDISDIISTHLNNLHNPTDWDYLLYLETTKAGQLINQFIPAESEQFLNIKINILKAALSKSALLLIAPEDDVKSLVNLLHHLSLRETLHIIELQTKEVNSTIAMQLFGLNSALGIKNNQPPLLEKLSDTGTLFINNAYLLELETQNTFAEFIRSGYFCVFKSDHKIPSNIRLICSLHPNIQRLLQEDLLSKSLYNTISSNTLTLPPLSTFPEQELSCLADRVTEQILQTDTFKNLLLLTEKDKQILLQKCPDSLYEFKQKIHHMLVKKSKKNNIYNEDAHFDTAHIITNPELVQAARLGKHALKDQKIMSLLWHTFKNQNKIASFLGVNRSSVNRRCKDYKLI